MGRVYIAERDSVKQLDQYNNAKLTQSSPNTAAPILHGDMAREDDVNSISMAYASFASEEAGLQPLPAIVWSWHGNSRSLHAYPAVLPQACR